MVEKIKESNKIAPYMTFFLVHPIQLGVGVLGFQAIIAKNAGYDSWVAVLLACIAVSFVLWVMYAILNKGGGSLITIHKEVFGRWLGGAVSTLFIIYYLFAGLVVLRTYAEVVQVWVFPEMKTWVISVMMLFLTFYTIIGGFRSVVGICFFGFFIPLIGLSPAFFALFDYTNFANLFPVMTHSIPDLLRATKGMALTMLGFEGILIAYPFIQKPSTSQKWAHLSNLFTTIMYLFITVITFGYYNKEEMSGFIWPTLSMLKIVHFPLLERFEVLAICLWFLVVLPNVVFMIWAASRGMKVLYGCKQKYALGLLVVLAFVLSLLFQDRQQIDFLNSAVGMGGFYFLFLYLPFLLIVQRTLAKVRKKA